MLQNEQLTFVILVFLNRYVNKIMFITTGDLIYKFGVFFSHCQTCYENTIGCCIVISDLNVWFTNSYTNQEYGTNQQLSHFKQ